MKRPDKNEVKNLIAELKAADQKIGAAAVTISTRKRSVKQYYSALSDRGVQESLKTIPIEDINRSEDTEGINTAALKAGGINTLEDVLAMKREDLLKIPGIGEKMADKIMAASIEGRNTIARNYVLRISEEDLKDVAYEGLVTDVYALIRIGKPGDEISSLYEQNHLPIIENSPKAEALNNTFSWLFANSREKEQRMDAYNTLLGIRESGYTKRVDELTASFEEAMKGVASDEAVRAFSSNTAPFFALLEQLCGKSAVKDEDQVLGLPEDVLNNIKGFELDTSLMKATLRDYQVFGTKYILNQQRTLLGDEMGLGKTMQSIAAMAHLKATGRTHFLVVCPVSVMVNWGREIEKHSLLSTMTIHGDKREEIFKEFIEKGNVAITTYETITRLPLEELTHVDMLTVDEAHYVKNPEAQRTKALSRIAAVSDYSLFMTGTPMENRVEEMVFLTSLLRNNVATDLKSMLALSKAPEFRTKIAPVYLRRVREDVLKELPEKIESEEWMDLTAAEKSLYAKSLVNNSFMGCRKVSYNVEKDEDSSKLTRLLELCREAKEDGRKVIIFSFYLDIINRVAAALGEDCFGIITGSVPAEQRQEMIDKFAESPDGSAIVSQIIAGGVGLNIQCASVVIICEPQWKPSTEDQAISRCYRMGQAKSVLVYRLLNTMTVDKRVMEILKEKGELFDNFADESAVGELNKKMIEEIMEEERKAYGIEAGTSSEISEEVDPGLQNVESNDDTSSIIESSNDNADVKEEG